MRAKATNLFKPKSEKEISSAFKKKYNLPYSDLQETYKQLKEFGIDARINKQDQTLQLFNWKLYMTEPDYGEERLIGEAWTKEKVDKVINALYNLESEIDFYITKSKIGTTMSLIDAIDLLTSLKKEQKKK